MFCVYSVHLSFTCVTYECILPKCAASACMTHMHHVADVFVRNCDDFLCVCLCELKLLSTPRPPPPCVLRFQVLLRVHCPCICACVPQFICVRAYLVAIECVCAFMRVCLFLCVCLSVCVCVCTCVFVNVLTQSYCRRGWCKKRDNYKERTISRSRFALFFPFFSPLII